MCIEKFTSDRWVTRTPLTLESPPWEVVLIRAIVAVYVLWHPAEVTYL